MTEKSNMSDEVKAGVKEVIDSVKSDAEKAVKETKHHLVNQLQEVKDEVTNRAESSVQDGRSQVASQVSGVASAFKRAGEELRGEDHRQLAGYTERIGDQVQGVADYLGERDIQGVITDIERFARRQPAAFIGASLAIGLLAARFLKSSRPDEVRRQP